MPLPCHGNCDDNCCCFLNVICPFLEENTIEGRRWTCGLMHELGDWDLVLADERYTTIVQDLYDTVPELKGMNCRDWFCKELIDGNTS